MLPLIPFRVRLAVESTSSSLAVVAKLPSYDATHVDFKLESYYPILSREEDVGVAANNDHDDRGTVAELTRYIVRNLFVENGEAHFLDVDGRRRRPAPDDADESERYARRILAGDYRDADADAAPSLKSSPEDTTMMMTCRFSLIVEETTTARGDGLPVAREISPSVDAYEMLRKLLCTQRRRRDPGSSAKLDLIVMARVLLLLPPPPSNPPRPGPTREDRGAMMAGIAVDDGRAIRRTRAERPPAGRAKAADEGGGGGQRRRGRNRRGRRGAPTTATERRGRMLSVRLAMTQRRPTMTSAIMARQGRALTLVRTYLSWGDVYMRT